MFKIKIRPSIQKLLLINGSLLLFFVLLEAASILALRNGWRPKFLNTAPRVDEEIWNFSDVRRHSESQTRSGELARIIIAGKYEKRIPPNFLTPEDLQLRAEPASYPPSNKGRHLQSASRVNANLNEEFSLYGRYSKKLKYTAHYTTDDTGMRQNLPGKNKNLIFIGCSYTFGQGLNDEETFPYLVGKKTGYRSFNKGVPGISPLIILDTIRKSKGEYFKNIPNDETTVVLTLIPEQFPRVFHTISFLRPIDSISDYPLLAVENDQLIIKNREDDLSEQMLFYLSRLKFPLVLNFDLPVYGEKEYRLFVRIIREIEAELKSQFPQVKNFAVALYPAGTARLLYKNLRKTLLEEKNLTVFDYSLIHSPTLLGDSFLLKYDGHPSYLASELYSDLLIHDLRKSFGI